MLKAIAISVGTIALASGCVGLDERPMNAGEDTLVSKNVLSMVEQNNGRLDTREHANVGCKRIKLTGSHIHTRICYTTEEERLQAEHTADEYYRRFGSFGCGDPGSAACNAGGEEPAGLQ